LRAAAARVSTKLWNPNALYMNTICKPNHLLVVVLLLSGHAHTQDTSLVGLKKKKVLKSNPRLALNKAILLYHSSSTTVPFIRISTDHQIQHSLTLSAVLRKVTYLPCNRLLSIIKNYRPKSRRKQGRPLKRLLEV